ncbi:hypothetical protein [Maribacter polysaccharolyticus]|uniref:hypothetical protein n=1 Tax=Maribacter polysaccharolyticus TaxID=3020831 RepID=UPI00237FC631|nr:hypothetical protein [Maribacter polysaccharolyticus]MDE3741136.1 hypothetical protein [Maribacter polysaccharolyticus]
MKYLILVLSLMALVSCKDGKNKEDKTITSTTTKPALASTNKEWQNGASSVYDNSWTEEIVMNNGIKWKADATTNEVILKMQNNIEVQTLKTLEDYHQLAEQLNEDIFFIVNNCTMKGGSHDNLHIWLVPLIHKIEALSETKTIENASKIKNSIIENIVFYDNYFE